MIHGTFVNHWALAARSSIKRRVTRIGFITGFLGGAAMLPPLLAQPIVLPAPKTSVEQNAPLRAAPAQSAQSGLGPAACSATTKGSFHLRPRPQAKSAGPKLPPGTSVEVLDQLALAESEKGRRGPIYKVRLVATGATGYVFLRDSELSAGCPLIWPAELELKAGTEVTEDHSDCLRPRGQRFIELFKPACRNSKGKPEVTIERRLDVDGDGRQDSIVTTELSDTKMLGLLLNTKAGWRTVLLEEDSGRNWEFIAATQAGAATYLFHQTGEFENYEDDEGETATDETNTYHGFRVERSGKVFLVFQKSLQEIDSNNRYQFAGNPDGSVTLKSGKRTVRLRWDEQHKLLVPVLS